MKQGEIYDETEELRRDARCEAVDEFYYIVLRNPITIDALVRAKDKDTVLAILKSQYDKTKESIIM